MRRGTGSVDKMDKVIKGLECCIAVQKYPDEYDSGCDKCPYRPTESGTCKSMVEILADALALLKAQEPVEPTLDIRHGKSMWRCGSCSTALQPNQMNAKFCFNCGMEVKWGG